MNGQGDLPGPGEQSNDDHVLLVIKFVIRIDVTMLIKLLIISFILIGLALAGLAITILLKPKGQFPDTHVGHNREMRKRGITCAQNTDTGCNPVDGAGCCGCTANKV